MRSFDIYIQCQKEMQNKEVHLAVISWFDSSQGSGSESKLMCGHTQWKKNGQ